MSAQFVIDDFEEGGPLVLSTNPADDLLSLTSFASNVPGGARHFEMRPSNDPEKQGFVELASTPGDDALVLTAFNPPNNGFITGSVGYGDAIPGQPELNLDVSGYGEAFYIDLVEESPGFRPWSGFYLIIQVDGSIPHFPDGIGSRNFLNITESGRHTIPFSYFGDNFDPTDIDHLLIRFWASEARRTTSPLEIFEIGVIAPEPTSITLLAAFLLTALPIRRAR